MKLQSKINEIGNEAYQLIKNFLVNKQTLKFASREDINSGDLGMLNLPTCIITDDDGFSESYYIVSLKRNNEISITVTGIKFDETESRTIDLIELNAVETVEIWDNIFENKF